jgi:hypothetical protein
MVHRTPALSFFRLITLASLFLVLPQAQAGEAKYQVARPGVEFKVFQFPHDAIPRIDGKLDDWAMVPDSYVYDTSYLNDTKDGHGTDIDPGDLDVKVTVGWVKGLNRLYFRYEAYDDFWDFGRFNPKGYLNDILEIVVDGDMSGGPFILNPNLVPSQPSDPTDPVVVENYTRFSGNHAQNYHIYTPPVNNAWVLVWGGQPWISEFPYSNVAYDYDFQHGESGKLIMELWITAFDHAPYEGPQRAVESHLVENEFIGVSWSILDFDGDARDGHYNLAHDVNMVKDASFLCAFRLMPIESFLQPDLDAAWSFKVLDTERRLVAFQDESVGEIHSWKWDFGDGHTSTEQHPIHTFAEKNMRPVITLEVNGPKGSSKRTRYWEVLLK